MRIAYRLIATTVALGLFVTSTPSVALAAEPGDVETLYAEGDSAFANGDYLGAARAWGKALDLMDESDDTNSTRAQILVSALSAYMEAFVETRNVDHLRAAARLLERYAQSLEAAYDGEARLSEAVIDMKRRLDNALENAEHDSPEGGADSANTTNEATTTQPTEPADTSSANPPTQSGRGMLIGGVVSTALGLGSASLLTIGLVQGQAAQKSYNGAPDGSKEKEDYKKEGEKANKMAIAGGIMTPIFLGAGIALLIIGSRRNQANLAVVPTWQPGYAGMGISGRF